MIWSFRIFDCDNSKAIAIGEFDNSVKAVCNILEGVGETEHSPGNSDEENKNNPISPGLIGLN